MGHFGLLTLSLVICSLSQAASEVYYIKTQCISDAGQPCLTLTQFATNSINHAHPNITLIFLPGKHYFRRVNFTLTNLDHLVMKSENSTAEIQCTIDSHFYFNQSQYILITNLEFIGCGGNQVKHVQEFVVKNSEFKGQYGSGTALELIETKAQIINSNFTSNNGTFRERVCFREVGCIGGFFGGAIISTSSTINISQSKFESNFASFGGAIFAEHHSFINMNKNSFIYNAGSKGVLYSVSSNITIEASIFCNNTATVGGALCLISGRIEIKNCVFHDNHATLLGGVLYTYREDSNIMISGSNFTRNRAQEGAVISVLFYGAIGLKNCGFHDNRATSSGGVLYSIDGIIKIDGSNFTHNRSPEGAVIYASSSSIMHHNNILYNNNSADVQGVITLYQSELIENNSSTSMTFSNNSGSLVLFYSKITLFGQAVFSNNTRLQTAIDGFQEGGAITLVQSNVNFNGVSHFLHNSAENGGAIHSTESKLYVNGNVTIAHNTATRNGGGVYLSNSELNCHQRSTFELSNNEARHKGGGLHAISSSINAASVLIFQYPEYMYSGAITFKENTAERGGGIALEANTGKN